MPLWSKPFIEKEKKKKEHRVVSWKEKKELLNRFQSTLAAAQTQQQLLDCGDGERPAVVAIDRK